MLSNRIKFTVLLLGMMLFSGCGIEKSEGYSFIASDVEFGEEDYQKIIPSNNELGFKLLTEIDEDVEGNIFISPSSLMMALSMVYNGADGETKAEIANALHLDSIDENVLNMANASLVTKLYKDTNKINLQVANSIWLNENYHFKEIFSKSNQDYYNAKIETIDIFDNKSAHLINQWVKESTNDKIDEIVEDPLDENLLAFLINAIYFKGQWTYEFDQKQTEEGHFHLRDGTMKDVSFMTLEEDLYYMETEDFQAVKLPYGDGEMSMNIFLPHENSSLHQFLELLTPDNWERWTTKFSKKEGTIVFPKFKLEYEASLKSALMNLGMEDAFDGQHADFSKMIEEDDQIYISDIKQKTFIDINEEGTEAAAATSVEMKLTSAPVDGPFYMKVNRPFLFTIVDEETGAMIFMGSIANPPNEG